MNFYRKLLQKFEFFLIGMNQEKIDFEESTHHKVIKQPMNIPTTHLLDKVIPEESVLFKASTWHFYKNPYDFGRDRTFSEQGFNETFEQFINRTIQELIDSESEEFLSIAAIDLACLKIDLRDEKLAQRKIIEHYTCTDCGCNHAEFHVQCPACEAYDFIEAVYSES